MPQVFSEYGSSFDDIVSDMLINWDNKLEQNIQNNNKSELLVNDLEKQLYNLSIEGKSMSSTNKHVQNLSFILSIS